MQQAMSSPSALPVSLFAAAPALAQADRSLQAWVCLDPAPQAAATGPLAGLDFGVKDVLDVAGLPTRCGSPASDATPAIADADCVARLRAAGARPLGKTVTAEFAHVWPGPTRNPAHAAHTPGGSSSGSAAAVAAGMVPFALGTQTGGSMIRPAAFCGVLGFKPSFGALSRQGMRVMCPSLDVIGWHARDAALAQRIGEVLLPPAAPLPAGKRPALRWLEDLPGHPLSGSAREALREAAAALQASGWMLAPGAPMAQAADLLQCHSLLVHHELSTSLAALAEHPALSPRLRAALIQGRKQAPADTEHAYASLQAWRARAWEADFGDADLILTAGALGPAPEGLAHTGESGFNKAWSVLGWPCLHLPTTHDARGLPLGVMLVARPGADHALLAWARQIHPLIDRRPRAAA